MDNKKFTDYYYLLLLGLALLINDRLIYWLIAVVVGDNSLKDSFIMTFENYSVTKFLFLTIFRSIPYLVLIFIVWSLSRKNEFKAGVAVGGLIAVLFTTIWGLWELQICFFTDERCGSTQAIGYFILCFWAVLDCMIGCIIGGLFDFIYKRFRER